MKESMVKKYEIHTADNNYLQAGETEDRKHILIVISELNTEKQRRMVQAVVFLTKEQWIAFCDLRYSLEVKDVYKEPEESEDA